MTTSVLARVVQILQEQHIPFALIGAAAMAAHGVSRSTFDTDLFSVGPSALENSIWQTLTADGIDVEVRHGDTEDPLLGVVRFGREEQAIDLVVGHSTWQSEVIARAVSTEVFSLTLPIVTVEDLVLLKLYAGGIQDRWDIQQLLLTSNPALATAEIDARVSKLPDRSQELWRQLRPN